MKIVSSIQSFLAGLFQRNEIAADLEDELKAHIAFRAEDLERSGLARAEAERRARIEFGSSEHYREESIESLGANFASTFLQDLHFSIRVLRKSPGFAVAAILTLALAIGANAVVFGVLNALVLRPVNVTNAQSLYSVDHVNNQWESYPNYQDIRDRNRSFDGLAAMGLSQIALDTGKDPSRLWGFEVTGNYFDILGIQPYLGRLFHSSDDNGANSAPYIVLSYAFWHAHFLGDTDVIGRTVHVNNRSYTVLGVAPPDFRGTFIFFAPNFYLPMVNHNQVVGSSQLSNRNGRSIIQVLGHLKPGVTKAQAVADLNNIGAELARHYPDEDAHEQFTLSRPSVPSVLGRPLRAFVAVLMLLASLILVAACANLGSLFAARASDRSRELALRMALGSSRTRILRQLLSEAVLLSLTGSALGLATAIALLNRMDAWQPFSGVPIHMPVLPDGSLYMIAIFLAVVSGIFFGIVPLRQVLRANPYEVVKAGPAGRIGNRIAIRDILLVIQITICAVLVTSSIVAVRGLVRALHSNFGFNPQNVMLVETDLNRSVYPQNAVFPTQQSIINALAAIPGVEHVGLVSFAPLGRGGSWKGLVFRDQDRDYRPPRAIADAYKYVISPDYFQAAGTALLQGRPFTEHDDQDAPRVAIVNRAFAAKVLGSNHPVGSYFRAVDGSRTQVVGIAEDGKYLSITEDPQPAMFIPYRQQDPMTEQWYLLRSHRDPQELAAAVKTALHSIDSGLPVDALTWNRELDFSLFPARMATLSLGVLGMMGAMLSITGIFGMAAYSVSKRLKELGIRVALGAQRLQILNNALGRPFRLLAVGSLAGLLLGLFAAKLMALVVYQATPRDPLVLAGAVITMLLLGLLATWIPAQRALATDPLALLREE